MTKKLIPQEVKSAIESGAVEYIGRSYQRHESYGGREPCLSVGAITDYLRQHPMPADFKYATKNRQRTWTRSVLESLRRKGKLGSSFAAKFRCYEPSK